MEWIYSNLLRRVQKSAVKVFETDFWDCQRVIIIELLDKYKTITGNYYSTLLVILREKFCGQKVQNVAQKYFNNINRYRKRVRDGLSFLTHIKN